MILISQLLRDWKTATRQHLLAQIPPDQFSWTEKKDALPLFEELKLLPLTSPSTFKVPQSFLSLAESVACYRSFEKWNYLYRVLWRLRHGEPHLLAISVDPDIHRLLVMEKTVRRDMHKMKAFVRFKAIRQDGQDHYVAWFEPEHLILEKLSSFFRQRFSSMRWSILTPDLCAHWNGESISFMDGVSRNQAPTEDALEQLWLTYYAHIFNPARLKVKAMQKEMPKKYWKNLPEAVLIAPLIKEAPRREQEMILQSSSTLMVKEDSMKKMVTPQSPLAELIAPIKSIRSLREAAADCKACRLWKNGTQTVFGEGSVKAQIMFVGEQPGDEEDIQGKPFVGPAGKMLNRALTEVGLDRNELYVTNAVKHFKWVPKGKRRFHQTPHTSEVKACHPWLEAEIHLVKPKIIVALGSTAAKALYGPQFRLLANRGVLLSSPWAPSAYATVHPSFLLRVPAEDKAREYQKFIADLKVIVAKSATLKQSK